jgi:hypothetical protein
VSTAPLVATPRPFEAMSLLGSGVPLSLLLDLAFGPHSEELFATEIPSPRRQSRSCTSTPSAR